MDEFRATEHTAQAVNFSRPRSWGPLSLNPVKLDGKDRVSPTLFSEDDDEDFAGQIIAKPPVAFTTPYSAAINHASKDTRSTSELTPPPSPTRGGSPTPTISTLQHERPHSRTESVLSNPFVSALNSPSQSQTRLARHSHMDIKEPDAHGRKSPGTEGKNRNSKTAFPALGLFSGASAPISFGFVHSPKKEEAPEGSPFGPCEKPRSPSPPRPNHVRRGSTLQAAANLLGLGASRPGSVSPTRHCRALTVDTASVRSNSRQGILELDLTAELIPDGLPNNVEDKAEGFDELLASSERLFVRIREAYRAQSWEMQVMQEEREEMEEARTRELHLKMQLDEMAKTVSGKESVEKDLQRQLEDERSSKAELEQMLTKERSVRVVGVDEDEAFRRRVERFAHAEAEGQSSDEEHSADGSVFDHSSRPSTPATAPDVSDVAMAESPDGQAGGKRQRRSMVWQDAAPYLPPEAVLKEENGRLRKRLAELEETVQMCLGLVDA